MKVLIDYNDDSQDGYDRVARVEFGKMTIRIVKYGDGPPTHVNVEDIKSLEVSACERRELIHD